MRALAQRHGISPTTVQKWRGRQTAADAAIGPKQPRSPVLTPKQEAGIVAFRRHTLPPLDDCLYALQPTIPALTRPCLHHHAISRLPESEGDKLDKKPSYRTNGQPPSAKGRNACSAGIVATGS